MNGKGRQNKGKNWERRCAKALSDWSGIEFRRTKGSGADKDAYTLAHELGDIRPKDPLHFEQFPLLVECKAVGKFPFHQILLGQCKVLDSWIGQVFGDRKILQEKAGLKKDCIVIFKANNVPAMVVINIPVLSNCIYRGWRVLALDTLLSTFSLKDLCNYKK